MKRRTLPFIGLILLGCSNAGEDLGIGVPKTATIDVVVYLDRDWSGGFSSGDTLLAGVRVNLLAAHAATSLATVTTDLQGAATFRPIEPGYYQVAVDTSVLSDTSVAEPVPAVDTVLASATSHISVGIGPPIASLQAARGTSAGKLLLVRGTITAGGQNYADGSAFMVDATGALRLRHVTNLNGQDHNNPGQFVRVRGRTSVLNGETILDSVQIYLVSNNPPTSPVALTTAAAATAVGGTQDAQFASVANATIQDTATVAGGFQVGVDDGSGHLVLRIDPLLLAPTAQFTVGAKVDAAGPLVAMGAGVWQLWPREKTDITVH